MTTTATTPSAKKPRSRNINRDRPKAEPLDWANLSAKLAGWYQQKRAVAEIKRGMDEDKAAFKTVVLAHGVADENGSLYLELPTVVDGIAALKNQKSSTPGLNAEYAEQLLRRKELWAEATTQVTVINPDAIHRLFYEKKITKAQLDAIFPVKDSYSFVLLDANGKQVS